MLIIFMSLTIIGLIVLFFWNKRKDHDNAVTNDYIDKYIPSGKILDLDDKTIEFKTTQIDGITTDKLIGLIAEDVDIAKDKTKKVLDAFTKIVVKIVVTGQKIIIQDFGTFQLSFEENKKTPNLKMVPNFKPSKTFIENINEEIITDIL